VPKIGLGHQQVTIPTALCLRDKGSLLFEGYRRCLLVEADRSARALDWNDGERVGCRL
jgi:hypothetical protein